MEDDRPNPEALLKAVQREEESVRRGKLKVFLGMAAGVGKTYAMLEDAHKLAKEHADVVVGIVNTHGRQDTAKLLEGLEVLPPKILDYKGTQFEELDLEAVLARKPDHVIVDELAHTNVSGSRHPKRWQDVMEILDHGIDVSTTINVQHIESLKDPVETITGIAIRETVPDSVIESATYIELIDITPKELLQRLKEGKVYLGAQAELASRNFFQEDRLTALREIALRFAADKVDHELQDMVTTIERSVGWKPRERLLVAVSHSPHSQKLIRATRRLAFTLDAPWIALHVDTGRVLDEAENEMLAKNLAIANELGAEVITTQDQDVALAIERIARQRQVTQVIVGRPPRKPLFGIFHRSTLLDRLASECKDIDIHVIRQTPFASASRKAKSTVQRSDSFSYFIVFCAVALFTVVGMLLEPFVSLEVIGYGFMACVLSLTLVFRKGPVIFASLLYGTIWNYFFTAPIDTFDLGKGNSLLLFFYIVTVIVLSILADRTRAQREMLIKREESSQAMYEIVRQIASKASFKEIVPAITRRLNAILRGQIEVLIGDPASEMEEGATSALINSHKERATASWVYENGKEAGWSTTTLPSSQNLYLPLKGHKEMVGLLIFRPNRSQELSTQEKNFLYTSGQQLAYYLERRFNEEKEREAQKLDQIEKIYREVANSLKKPC